MRNTIRSIILIMLTIGFTSPALATDTPMLFAFTSDVHVSLAWTPGEAGITYSLYYAPYPYTGPGTIGIINMGTQTDYSGDLWDGASFYVAITATSNNEESQYSNIELIQTNVGNNSGESHISYMIGGNVSNEYIGQKITFTRYTFAYLPDNEQNAMSLTTDVPGSDSFQDIIGWESYEYRASHDYYNSLYIRLTDKAVGTYSFGPNSDSVSPMYLTITTGDGKTYKSTSSTLWPSKNFSVTITESKANRIKGTFTATLDVYSYQDGALFFDQELSEEGQFFVNGQFDVIIIE